MSKSRKKKKNQSKHSRTKKTTSKSLNRQSSSEPSKPSSPGLLQRVFGSPELEPIETERHARQIETRTTVEWSGPLPTPQILREFNEIVPGAAERLITMAETEGEHRRGMQEDFLKLSFKREMLGIGSGFSVSIVLIGAAVYVATFAPWVAGLMVSGSFVSALAGVLHSKRHLRQQEQGKLDDNEEDVILDEEAEAEKPTHPE